MTISSTEDRNNLLTILDVFLLSLAFYLLILSGYNGFDVGKARIDVLSSLTNNLDLNVADNTGVKGVDGRDYSWFGIGSVLLGLPFYLFGKQLGIEPATLVPLVNVLFSAATNSLIYIFTHYIGYSRRISVIVSLIYGFTTMACYYAKDPGDQCIETFFILLSVYCMYRHVVTGKVSFTIYAAASVGMAVITRINAVIAIPAILTLPLLKYTIYNHSHAKLKEMSKCICAFIIGLVPFAALFMWYNHYRYGSVLETGNGIMASKWGVSLFAGTNPFTGLAGLLLSPGKGFFYYSPMAFLFFISIRHFYRSNSKLTICLLTLIISYLIFYCKFLTWHGDWAWGPRYLLAILPYFIIPIASILDNPAKKLKASIIALLVLGLTIQILAISINPYRYFIYLQHAENIKFVVTGGNGVQPLQELPKETYFNWRKSPILYNLYFLYHSAININKYKYLKNNSTYNKRKDVLSEPYMNTLDFQWLYTYYINHTYNGFYSAFIILIIFLVCIRNLHKHSKDLFIDNIAAK